MTPETLERLRAWEFDGQDAEDFRALLAERDELRAQVEAARAWAERNTEPVDENDMWSAGYAAAIDDLLTAMDEAKARRG